MKNKSLLIWIPVTALICNGLGYVIVSNLRSTSKATPSAVARSTEPRGEDPEKEQSGRARRAAGLAALEAGDYGKALINFTEARALLGERARVDELLRVTEDLRARGRTTSPTESPASSAPPIPTAPVARFNPAVRVNVRAPAAPPPRPPTPEPAAQDARIAAPSATASGLLLVTTTPRGLLVQVDGAPVDLTPMRTSVKAGTHRVVLFDGDRRLYETSVEVSEGNPTTLLRDLSAEMAPESARANVLAASVKDEAARATAAPAPPNPDGAAAPQAPKPPAATEPGGLDITSPGLYGVVWVNGRPVGYPPVRARDIPPGPAKIEVRVNGVEKRATTVVVQPGVTTPVKLR